MRNTSKRSPISHSLPVCSFSFVSFSFSLFFFCFFLVLGCVLGSTSFGAVVYDHNLFTIIRLRPKEKRTNPRSGFGWSVSLGRVVPRYSNLGSY